MISTGGGGARGGGGGGGGNRGNSFYDTMTWETRSVLIDRRSKKIHLHLYIHWV